MTAYQNRLISLNYMEDIDILTVTWSNLNPYSSQEIQESVDKVIETINTYHCQKLLIDASEANFSMDDEAITVILTNFARQLGQTGLKKLARIITSDQGRENRIQSIRDQVPLPFQIYDISNREQAYHWLQED